MIENGEPTERRPLEKFPVVLGRDSGCDLVFASPRVSRRHAVISLTKEGYLLEDQQSTHMTFVNASPVSTHRLQHGDLISLADEVKLVFLIEAQEEEEPLERILERHFAPEEEKHQPDLSFTMVVSSQIDTLMDSLRGESADPSVLNQLQEQFSRSIRELQCLYEVGTAINSEQELGKVLQLIIRHVLSATGGERGLILFYDEESGDLVPVIARDTTATLTEEERSRFSRSIAMKAIETGEAIVAKDTLSDPAMASKSMVDFNIRSAICAPLKVKGKTLGVLYVDAKESLKSFSQRDTDFFSALANQSAIAIENARLVTNLREANRALERKVKELTALYEVSQSLMMVNDMETVLAKILEQSIETICSQRGSILLIDDDGKLRVRVAWDKERGRLSLDGASRTELSRGEGIAGWVLEHGEGLISNLGYDDPLFKRTGEHERTIRQLLCVPLKIKNETIGAINLVNKLDGEGFTHEDLKLLSSLASQAAVTIENFRLYHLAVFDGLTNLHIHRYFQAWLEKEFAKSKRYGSPLSLILLDIDHFKKFNDTYGHQIGDLVLMSVAKVLKETAREVDLVARYGGEEFAAVLPETDEEGAKIFAERLRRNVEENEVHAKGKALKVTISLGIADAHLSRAATKDELINFADQALYRAKAEGRNRWCVYRPPLSSRELAAEALRKLREE